MRGLKMDQFGEVLADKGEELRSNTVAVLDTFKDKTDEVKRIAQRAQRKAEDLADEARHEIKERPFTAVGVGLIAGTLVGAVAGWLIGYNWNRRCKG